MNQNFPDENLATLQDLLEWGTAQFEKSNLYYGHGTDNAWDEAVYIALHILQLPYDSDPKILEMQIKPTDKEAIINLFTQRIETRKPAAYLINTAYFAGLAFYVDERVMIPRSPFAELIEHAYAPWVDPNKIHQILDLCTGSGCLAIASAFALNQTHIDAVDISEDALEVAKINIEKHQLQDRVKLIHSDLYKNVPEKKYDLIISNPPYVNEISMQGLPEEFTHEPEKAFYSAENGLLITETIISHACDYLTEEGILIVEVGEAQEALEIKYPKTPFIWLEFSRGGEGVFMLRYADLLSMKI